jgi:HlyD family type I secretion membrane fusion protein
VLALVYLRVDRVVSGRGVLVPPDNTCNVAALRSGVVRQVLVREGQLVSAGEPLVRLDTSEDQTAVESLTAQVLAGQAELERRESLIGSRRELARLKIELLASEKRSEVAGLAVLQADTARLKSESERWEKELARQSGLYEKKIITLSELELARIELEKLRSQQIQVETSLVQKRMLIDQLGQKAAAAETEAAVEALQEELAVLDERRSLAALQQQLADAKLRLARATIVAPAAGRVHALAVPNGGEFLKESDIVCRLVPQADELIAEVELAAGDVGFAHPGQKVKIKLDAFPFEDYGALDGRLTYVAADADPAEAAGRKRRPVYTVRVHVDAQSFAARHERKLEFRPGLTLTAELVDRQETLAAMLFRPLRKAGQELSMR